MVTRDRANITIENTSRIVPEQLNPIFSLPNQTVRRRGAPPELQEAGNKMKEAFNLLKIVISKRTSDKDDDEYDLFGKMLTKKIRKLSEHEREIFMYEIAVMYINKLRNVNSFSTHSNTSSTSTERFDT